MKAAAAAAAKVEARPRPPSLHLRMIDDPGVENIPQPPHLYYDSPVFAFIIHSTAHIGSVELTMWNSGADINSDHSDGLMEWTDFEQCWCIFDSLN